MDKERSGETMKLGAFFHPTGNHVAAWLHPDAQIDAGTNFRHYAERPYHGNYRRAERGKGKSGVMMLRLHLATAPPLRLGRSAAWTVRRGVVED